MENSTFCKNMHRRIVRNFLDVLVLAELRKRPLCGYDVITFVHEKFRLLVSSGTAYSVLYSLERKGLIAAIQMQRRRAYKLTDKGEEMIKRMMSASDETQYLVLKLLRLQEKSMSDSGRWRG
jgi:DNA-binding PadR family transcriptional regulator